MKTLILALLLTSSPALAGTITVHNVSPYASRFTVLEKSRELARIDLTSGASGMVATEDRDVEYKVIAVVNGAEIGPIITRNPNAKFITVMDGDSYFSLREIP